MKLIESILFKDGDYHNLDLHQGRMDRAFDNYAPEISSHDLKLILPKLQMDGLFKVRLVYDMDTEDVEYDIEFAEYVPRKIESLEVMVSSPFDYSMKYEDRSKISKLIKKTSADDIIISINELVTDGSYFNLAFWDGSEWFTPDTPLLNGVRRQQLLRESKIKERRIKAADIKTFQKVSLINAMLDLGELEVSADRIHY